MLEYYRKLDEERFWKMVGNWRNTFRTPGGRANVHRMYTDILKVSTGQWDQDRFGNYRLFLSQYQVLDGSGSVVPFEVLIPPSSPVSRKTLPDLLEYSLGIKKPDKRLGGGTRSVGGLIQKEIPLAITYSYDLDLTCTDRQIHIDQLRNNGSKVPVSWFATTNTYLSGYIDGKYPTEGHTKQLSQEEIKLNGTRDRLIDKQLWDPGVNIDSQPLNYRVVRRGFGLIEFYNIDPVVRHAKFEWG